MKPPKISVVMPVYNVERKYFEEAINSVLNQKYKNWELCIADASSDYVSSTIKKDIRIKIKRIENQGIAKNTNIAISFATGEYITFLDHDDTLDPTALLQVSLVLCNNEDLDIVYTDEDKLNGNIQSNPFFKPDWSPDMLTSYNYICHLCVYRKSFLDELGGLREGFDGAQDYDLILRATEKTDKIYHIPKVLYHWRLSNNSTSKNPLSKPYTMDAGKRALTDHLKRINREGIVKDGMFINSYKIEYKLNPQPKVTIIICNHNQTEFLENCIESIENKTTYSNYDILIIENNSTEPEVFDYYKKIQEKYKNIRVITWNKLFNFSLINNFGVENTDSEYILLLNNDTKVIAPDWLDRMMEYIIRKDVGVVGAKLYYHDDTIQHVGVIILNRGPVHIGCKMPRNTMGWLGRFKVVQNLTCVTGACLLTKRSIYNEVGGLDETWALAFNDVDYCFKVFDKGYRIVWTPYAELYHYESKTRGYEDTPEKKKRFKVELFNLLNKWSKLLTMDDPMYRLRA